MTTSRYQNVRTPVEIGGSLSPPLSTTPRLDYPITMQGLIGVSPLQGTAEVKVHSTRSTYLFVARSRAIVGQKLE